MSEPTTPSPPPDRTTDRWARLPMNGKGGLVAQLGGGSVLGAVLVWGNLELASVDRRLEKLEHRLDERSQRTEERLHALEARVIALEVRAR